MQQQQQQQQQQQHLASTTPKPEIQLLITEQPSKVHRFRYPTEARGDKLGGKLHSKASSDTPVTVRVDLLDHRQCSEEFVLLACTFNEDLQPHIHQLCGDGCDRIPGVMYHRMQLGGDVQSVCVKLDRTGIVCQSRKRNKTDELWKQRLALGCNFFNTSTQGNPYKHGGLDKVRIGFQIFRQQADGSLMACHCEPVATTVICHSKNKPELVIDCVIPNHLPARSRQDLWLYMGSEIETKPFNRFTIIFENQDGQRETCSPTQIRKQLLIVSRDALASIRCIRGNCKVCVIDNEFECRSNWQTLSWAGDGDGVGDVNQNGNRKRLIASDLDEIGNGKLMPLSYDDRGSDENHLSAKKQKNASDIHSLSEDLTAESILADFFPDVHFNSNDLITDLDAM